MGSYLGGVVSTALGVDRMIFVMMLLPAVSLVVMFCNTVYQRRAEQRLESAQPPEETGSETVCRPAEQPEI